MMKTIAVAVILISLNAFAVGVEIDYKSGYDPAKGRPDGIGEIADGAWGEAVGGLRAAFSGPAELRFNEAKTALRLERSSDRGGWAIKQESAPLARIISGEAKEAIVTYHLHMTNGTEYTEGLKGYRWPAKGGWSGRLRTAPVKVLLNN